MKRTERWGEAVRAKLPDWFTEKVALMVILAGMILLLLEL